MKMTDLIKTKKQLRDELLPLLRKCNVGDDLPIKVHLNLTNLYTRQHFYDLLFKLFPEYKGLDLTFYLNNITYNELIEEINRRAEL